ncbi:hypothetical protein [Altericista sp. CCNU0014]|uniref:hypothetical protein n=1 Tax=Altericista sp. CCNU0014 TaxID=3082949 RepID=UPI00385003F4
MDMSRATSSVFCCAIALSLLSSWPTLAQTQVTQPQVVSPPPSPSKTDFEGNASLSPSELFEQHQEKRALQQEQWQQKQARWQYLQDLKFQRQYLKQQRQIERQMEFKLRGKQSSADRRREVA